MEHLLLEGRRYPKESKDNDRRRYYWCNSVCTKQATPEVEEEITFVASHVVKSELEYFKTGFDCTIEPFVRGIATRNAVYDVMSPLTEKG